MRFLRAIFRPKPAFYCLHICATTNKQKRFAATDFADALEWVDCALSEDVAIIVNRFGAVCFTRKTSMSF